MEKINKWSNKIMEEWKIGMMKKAALGGLFNGPYAIYFLDYFLRRRRAATKPAIHYTLSHYLMNS
jgi:hypothetical protein